jgi:hypothetical protein
VAEAFECLTALLGRSPEFDALLAGLGKKMPEPESAIVLLRKAMSRLKQ